MNSSEYKPFVPSGSIRKNKDKITDFEAILAENENLTFEELFDEERQHILELAGSVLIQNVSQTTLTKVERQLMSIAKDIIQGWNQRQTKTVLHEKMIKTFGKIHSNNDPETHYKNMLGLLKEFIDSLPSSQSDYFDSNRCFEGFLNWNSSWKKFSSRYSHKLPIEIVHTAYESWCIETKGNHTEFKELWENCMIRSFSEAVCETVGSV